MDERPRRPWLRVAPKRSEWRKVLRRWLVILGVFALGGFAIWFFMLRMPGRSHSGPLPPLTDAQRTLMAELKADVLELSVTIGERNTEVPAGLAAARRHVEARLAGCGEVKAQEYLADGETCANVEAEIAGGERASEIVVVGGHYDSAPNCPGANDNATGAAAVIALARRFAGSKPARTLRFVAFVNEEPPWYAGPKMGSAVYARRCKERGENVVAMLSLETLGCYSDAEDSQKYPHALLKLAYPSRADFITFVGNVSSRLLTREVVGTFRESAAFPSEGAALPAWLQGVDWSDHRSFWAQGYPAVMVTDTAVFRFAEYHTPRDTPDKVDFERFARVVDGLDAVVRKLANPERE